MGIAQGHNPWYKGTSIARAALDDPEPTRDGVAARFALPHDLFGIFTATVNLALLCGSP